MGRSAWLFVVLGVLAAAGPVVVAVVALRGAHARSGPLVDVRRDDPELDVAIKTAQLSLPTFVKELDRPEPDVVRMAIKARLRDANHAEELWVDHLSYDPTQGVFAGELADAPTVVPGKRGDRVRVAVPDVVDWIIVHRMSDGTYAHEGAWTDEVLRRQASRPESRASAGARA